MKQIILEAYTMVNYEMKHPRYADRCRNFEKNKKLICYVCPKPLQNKKDTWDKHVNDPQHLSIMNRFNQSFCETKFTVMCKMCSKSFPKHETVQHAITHQFSPWHKPENLYFIFLINFIARIDEKYYCHLCKEQFLYWHIALGHANDQKHQLLQRDKICEDIGDKLVIDSTRCESLINHSVFPKNSLIFECMVCDRPFGGYQNFEEHIKGRGHRAHEEKLTNKLKDTISSKKQEAVIQKSISVGKRKKKFKGKRSGSTGVKSKSTNKEKSKSSGPSQTDVPPKAATSEVRVKSSSNLAIDRVADGIMALELTPSEASSVPSKTVYPHRQLARVIHKPGNIKATITCPKCEKKVKDHVELHVHLTSHFWHRFVRFRDVNENQPNASTHDDHPNELNINGEEEIIHQENHANALDVAPLELNKLMKQFSNMQPFSVENGKTIDKIFSGTDQNHKVTHTHLISSKYEQPVTTHNLKREELEPPVITSKGTSRLQFLENLNKQLASNIEHTIDEPIVMNEWSHIYKFPAELSKNETMKATKTLPKSSNNNSKRITNDLYSGSNVDYIYDIDNKQLEDIKLGIVLSFVRDVNNIYCLICRKNVRNSTQDIHEHLCNDKHHDYLKQMQLNHLRFETFPNTLSDLHLALHFMEETSDLYVKCWACDETIQNDTDILKHHIEIDDHKENCKKLAENSAKLLKPMKTRMFRDWYNVLYYWCVICGEKFTSECAFVKHVNSFKHERKCRRYKVFENLMYDFCPPCATLWLGFQCTFACHCECKMHRYLLRDSFYYITELPKEAKNILRKRPNMCDGILEENIDQDEKSKEERIVNDLLEVAREEFFRAQVYPFGSRVSGLASKNADLDVFIDCNDVYYKGNSFEKSVQHLKAVEDSLKNHMKTWKIDRTIFENVRIPIIKTHHRPTGIECDISFTNGLTVENTKLIRNYINMYPLCRNLIIFVKKWINACDLSGPNGLTSYSVAWMVIYHLQMQNILPSVAELIRLKGQSMKIAGWETGVEENFHVQGAEYSFNQLLHGFFITYSQFDYRCHVICPLLGKPVKKHRFEEMDLPNEMSSYESHVFSQMDSLPEIDKFRIDSAISVQDPFDLSHNLTKGVKKFIVHRLRKFCLLSAQTLEKNV